jgi:hypothetical protein
VYQSGKVAFVWTNPERALPGFGVSPLVIWTARHGAHFAAERSAVGTFATSASDDGDRVVFTANSPAGNTSGDLVLASADLAEQTTVASGIAMAFPNGPCVPRAIFLGEDLVITSCPAATTAATLAIWRHGHRHQLAEPLLAPPRLRLDQERKRIATVLASQRPVLLDRRLDVHATDDVTALNALIAGDGALIHITPGAGFATATRVKGDRPPRAVANFAGLYAFAFGSVGLSLPITSDDGRWLSYFDAVNPSFGAPANVLLRDVRDPDAAPITLDTSPANAVFGVPFTRDSDYALYARFDTTNFAVGPMFAAGPRGNRQFSDDAGWQWDAAFGSTITYNDNTTLDPNNVLLSTADLKSLDLSRPNLAPRLIATQANVTYFSSHRGHGVAYTIDTGAAAGLYVARVN